MHHYFACCLVWLRVLMNDNEEPVLVQLASQHRHKERPVQPILPDCIFFSYIYVIPNFRISTLKNSLLRISFTLIQLPILYKQTLFVH